MASTTASVCVRRRSGIDVFEAEVGFAGVGRGSCASHRILNFACDLSMDALELSKRFPPRQEPIREQVEWVLDVGWRIECRAIGLVIAGPVAAPAPGAGLDQTWTLTPSCACHRPLHCRAHGLDVV